MTTQATNAVCFSGSGGRSYSLTSTDDSWNRLVSDIGSAQFGFAQTNQLVTHVQVQYTAGAAAWRIRNSVSQVTKRVGFCYAIGAGGAPPYSGAIQPMTVEQDDVLEIYPVVA